VAKRSGDTAFAQTQRRAGSSRSRADESGVALRFPPQSKTRAVSVRPSRQREQCRQPGPSSILNSILNPLWVRHQPRWVYPCASVIKLIGKDS